MSIHHEVSVHCDACGHWQYGNESNIRQRRQDGWLIWRSEDGHWRHLCPICSAAGARTMFGERPDEVD